jgi:uncharacterized membrane protein YcaP (DUF421 family)
MLLGQAFGVGTHPITLMQECARAALLFPYGVLLLRLLGRRAAGKWSALDIIVAVIVGSSLSRAMTGNADLWGTMAAAAVVMGFHAFIGRVAALWPMASRLLEGRAIPILEGRRLDETAMKFRGVSQADLYEALRGSGLTSPEEAERVTLEPSGRLTVLRPQEERPSNAARSAEKAANEAADEAAVAARRAAPGSQSMRP